MNIGFLIVFSVLCAISFCATLKSFIDFILFRRHIFNTAKNKKTFDDLIETLKKYNLPGKDVTFDEFRASARYKTAEAFWNFRWRVIALALNVLGIILCCI